jgi:hypothetical protein
VGNGDNKHDDPCSDDNDNHGADNPPDEFATLLRLLGGSDDSFAMLGARARRLLRHG